MGKWYETLWSKIMSGINMPAFLTSFVSQLVPNIISFAFSMCGFVMAVTFIFSAIEEIGYMARMAFVFDSGWGKIMY